MVAFTAEEAKEEYDDSCESESQVLLTLLAVTEILLKFRDV